MGQNQFFPILKLGFPTTDFQLLTESTAFNPRAIESMNVNSVDTKGQLCLLKQIHLSVDPRIQTHVVQGFIAYQE